jgi:hypothetical protein
LVSHKELWNESLSIDENSHQRPAASGQLPAASRQLSAFEEDRLPYQLAAGSWPLAGAP